MTNVESWLEHMIDCEYPTPERRAGLIEIRNLLVEQRLDRESDRFAPRRNRAPTRAERAQAWWDIAGGEVALGNTFPGWDNR